MRISCWFCGIYSTVLTGLCLFTAVRIYPGKLHKNKGIYRMSQKRLTSLERHSLAKKQDKSTNYNLLESRKSNLDIGTKVV